MIEKTQIPLLVIRIWLGFVLAIHGYQKVFGGMDGWTSWITSLDMPLLNSKFPKWIAILAAWVELLGGIALILGLATRPVAVIMSIFLVFAIYLAHWKSGFFVNKGGYEYALTLLILAVVLAYCGGGDVYELYKI